MAPQHFVGVKIRQMQGRAGAATRLSAIEQVGSERELTADSYQTKNDLTRYWLGCNKTDPISRTNANSRDFPKNR